MIRLNGACPAVREDRLWWVKHTVTTLDLGIGTVLSTLGAGGVYRQNGGFFLYDYSA